MRFLILCFFILIFQNTYCQIDCRDAGIGSDYPPGCAICNRVISGDNIGFTPDDTISYDFPCGAVDNSIWYTFMTNPNGRVFIDANASDCKKDLGLEMVIFDTNLKRVSSCLSVVDNFQNYTINLEGSTTYYLVVDGIDSDECGFSIDLGGLGFSASGFLQTIPRLAKYCVAGEICFSPTVAGIEYQWKVPPDDSIVSGGGPTDDQVCLWFQTIGEREISVEVDNPCFGKLEFSEDILIESGFSLFIDSIQSDKENLCLDDEVTFFYDWKFGSVNADWRVSGTDSPILGGGARTDTFLRTKITNEGVMIEVSISPNSECGIPAFKNFDVPRRVNERVDTIICRGSCFQVNDSCYSETGIHFINSKLLAQNSCDSLVTLNLTVLSAFPSPILDCKATTNGIQLNWTIPNGAEEYVIFVDRDSIATVVTNSFLIENIPIGEMVEIKVQPRGSCSYLPVEIVCNNVISGIDDDFLNNRISIFPNPTTGNLNIETDLKIEEIEIYNTAGRLLQKEKITSFELENQEAGVYFLKIKTSDGVGVKRILVN